MHNKHTYILDKLRRLEKLGKRSESDTESGIGSDYNNQFKANLNELIKTIPKASSVFAIYNKNIADLNTSYAQLSQGMGKALGVQAAFNKSFEDLVSNITFLEEHNKQLNETFAIGSETAQKYAETLRDIGISIGFGDKKVFKYAGELNDLTNGMLMSTKANEKYRESLIGFQAYAQEGLGIDAEDARGFESYAALIGQTATDAAYAIKDLSEQAAIDLGIDPLTAQRDIIQEIGSLSDEVRLNYSRMPGSLELAVLKAKALGFTMDQLDNTGENLMNIEQSIGKEIEYQLLSGQRLLVQGNKSFTNEYRKAKAMGQSEKMADLMNEILDKQGDVLRNNPFARKEFAELIGMQDKELSAVLAKDKIAKELGVTELRKLSGDALKTKVDELKKEYAKAGPKGEEQIDKLNKLMESQDTRTTHEKVVEDNLVSIATSMRSIGRRPKKGEPEDPRTAIKVEDLGNTVRTIFLKTGAETFSSIKTVLDKQAKTIGGITLKSETFNALTTPVKDLATQMTSLTNIIGQFTATVQKFLTIKLPTMGAKTPNDALIIPDKGPILRPAKNDVIAAFRPNDVIHNTVNEMAVKPAANTSNMSVMIAALDKTIRSIQTPNNNVNVTMDTTKLAKDIATAMQSVKVEAKIRTDDMYASNRINNRKNII